MPEKKDYFDRIDYEITSLANNKIVISVFYIFIFTIKSVFNKCFFYYNNNNYDIKY